MYFFADLYLPQDGGDESFCSDGVGYPYKLFLKAPWVNKQLASSDFIFGTRKKAADVKYGKKLSWEDILTPFFLPPITENSRNDGSWVTAGKKQVW